MKKKVLGLGCIKVVLCVSVVLLLFISVGGAQKQACSSKLGQYIQNLVNQKNFEDTTWAFNIINPTNGSSYYKFNPDKFFTPASNTKLLTTSALFTLLPINYRYNTWVYSRLINSQNELCVQGSGDPSLATFNFIDLIQKWVKTQPHNQNITLHSVSFDESIFNYPLFPDSWEYEDLQAYYGAVPSALTLNENAFSLNIKSGSTIGSPILFSTSFHQSTHLYLDIINLATTVSSSSPSTLDIHYPIDSNSLIITGNLPLNSSRYFGVAVRDRKKFLTQQFKQALSTQPNLSFSDFSYSECNVSDPLQKWTKVAFTESEELRALMNWTLKVSDNTYAELFLKLIATQWKGRQSNATTYQNGLNGIKQLLTKIGVDVDKNLRQVDGSGLSRHNLVNSEGFVQILRGMMGVDNWRVYKSFLPTLDSWLKGTPAEGRVSAKTGSMTGVTTLSGYVSTKHFDEVVFSFLSNSSDRPNGEVWSLMTNILNYLVVMENC